MNGEGDKDLEEMGEGITVTSEEVKATAEKINKKLEQLADATEEKEVVIKKKTDKSEVSDRKRFTAAERKV